MRILRFSLRTLKLETLENSHKNNRIAANHLVENHVSKIIRILDLASREDIISVRFKTFRDLLAHERFGAVVDLWNIKHASNTAMHFKDLSESRTKILFVGNAPHHVAKKVINENLGNLDPSLCPTKNEIFYFRAPHFKPKDISTDDLFILYAAFRCNLRLMSQDLYRDVVLDPAVSLAGRSRFRSSPKKTYKQSSSLLFIRGRDWSVDAKHENEVKSLIESVKLFSSIFKDDWQHVLGPLRTERCLQYVTETRLENQQRDIITGKEKREKKKHEDWHGKMSGKPNLWELIDD